MFLNRDNMTWDEFSSDVRNLQIGFMGEPNEASKAKGSFHENPLSCICRDGRDSEAVNATDDVERRSGGRFNGEGDQDLAETEYDR